MSNAPESAAGDAENLAATFEQVVMQWQIIISTQMHFNDMILRTRAIGSSVVLAAYGAAAISLVQYPKEYLVFVGLPIHISVFVICFALFLLLSVYLMDVTYYYKLLLGVVEIGTEFEDKNSSLVGMSRQLSEKVSLRSANFTVRVFYAIPAAIGGGALWYIFANYPPPDNTSDISYYMNLLC